MGGPAGGILSPPPLSWSCPASHTLGLRRPLPAQACAGLPPSAWPGPQRVRPQLYHFSFFSSPFDAEGSVPSLDPSVTAAASLGFDSS